MNRLARIPLLIQSQVKCMNKISLQSAYRFSSLPPLPKDIDFTELKEELDKDAVKLIDVRLPKELREAGMIPKSKNIILQMLGVSILLPDEVFADKYGFEKPNVDEPIVVMCLAGIRARTAQLAMMGAGYKNVRVYVGSYEDWLENGGPVVYPEARK
ncbi:rhodanese domain-containing protein CG4456-like [Penaeus japonicus]|uniref:rhodanese domain-containing protein CG4456-like n=1 Tax=Penaeus japonicus TaxID=27405 RepID=UPI001C70D09F|nr:rhodanese domain-containing protein CG4456-like [Penaeus japonicus]XP_042864794.1 rhodanese domain-containing protein CG4456-like [Penaeus japonicus]XP_042864795.1 rhodanese domain-containing protein CG4456-like [Penaeus japonicus]XP_042864797.1 rhodanese domain-containing protein CG4456-like [Penaeus japonicus]